MLHRIPYRDYKHTPLPTMCAARMRAQTACEHLTSRPRLEPSTAFPSQVLHPTSAKDSLQPFQREYLLVVAKSKRDVAKKTAVRPARPLLAAPRSPCTINITSFSTRYPTVVNKSSAGTMNTSWSTVPVQEKILGGPQPRA